MSIILSALLFIVLVCMCVGEQRTAILIILFFPTLDVFSDLAYLLANDFYDLSLFLLCALSIALPSGYFWSLLHNQSAIPALYWSFDRAIWLEANSEDDYIYYPVFPAFSDGHLPWLSQKEHNTFISVLLEGIAWIIAFLAQLATLVVMIPGNIAFLGLWFLVGCMLHLTKLMSVGKVWNVWFSVWTRSDAHATTVDVDTAQLIACLEQEFYIETIPQFIIQLTNNLLLKRFTTIAAFSMALSIFMSVNSIWKYIYYRYVTKEAKAIEDIPVEMVIHIKVDWLGIDWQLLDARLENRTKEDKQGYKEPMLRGHHDDDDDEEGGRASQGSAAAVPVAVARPLGEQPLHNKVGDATTPSAPFVPPAPPALPPQPPAPPVERNLS